MHHRCSLPFLRHIRGFLPLFDPGKHKDILVDVLVGAIRLNVFVGFTLVDILRSLFHSLLMRRGKRLLFPLTISLINDVAERARLHLI